MLTRLPMDFANEGGAKRITQPDFPDAGQIRVLLLDIEGTTTPVDFVYKTLFPYAKRKLESFLRAHSHDPETQSLIQDLQKQSELDELEGNHPPVWLGGSAEGRLHSTMAYARWLMDRDSKCGPLKVLQGKIWREGYENGELRGEVYPDVPRAFDRWRRLGKEICIYSSGSVLAQQLLFRTVASGDLTTGIAAFFDTQVGSKTAAGSYAKIAASRRRTPPEFLFISDAVQEIKAAQSIGFHAILCDREARAWASLDATNTTRSFDEILPD